MDSKQDPNAAQSAPLGPSEVRIAAVDAHGIAHIDAHGIAHVDGSTQTDGALALDVDALPAPVTREQRRSRRKRAIRARTISVKRMTKRELELGRMLYPEVEEIEHPRTRADCVGGERPCPFVSCKHHLYLDVSARTGAIKLNFPDLEVWEMTETCALDVADRGGTTLEEVGAIMNLTRERIRQVEVKGLAKLAALRDMSTLRDYVDEGPTGKRRLPLLDEKPEEEDEDDEDVSDEAGVCADEAEATVVAEVNVDAFSIDLD
jgi:sigma-70-like protein